MPDDSVAQKAIAELDGATVDGRAIKVTVAKPREERSNNNNNSNSGDIDMMMSMDMYSSSSTDIE